MAAVSGGFHGYGYGSWQTPGTYGTGAQRGIVSGRGYVFHQGAQYGGAAHALASPVPNPAGTVTARPEYVKFQGPKPGAAQLLKPEGHPWMAKLFDGAGAPSRRQVFSQYPQPQAPQPQNAGEAGYRKTVGPGARRTAITTTRRTALGGRPSPTPIGTITYKGALGSGPKALPVGARPMGGAPQPLALTPQAGVQTTAPGTGKRKRQEVFGQMMFGET